ncbi:toxic anion resistance protein [Agitococcus lubricus]|uniref:Toxic anion resistance protein TelA n=1 Tax=Agitococcus lubricus TaxID=1077255 RepID=A0A2T5J1T5_9GAMM|nr:toxic anion resistance protein [Agitococcus lubricus]PTQ90358.1 toxic anion resistance protein TelA [Agitococcus lubricus]
MVKTFHQVNAEKNQQAQLAEKTGFSPNTTNSTPQAGNPPKALFQPTVQASVDAYDLQQVEQAISRLKLNDFQFSPADIHRASLLKNTIRLQDPNYVTDYGAEASQLSENILNQLNTITHADAMIGIKKYLGLILQEIQRVDIKAIQKSDSPSLFTRLFSKSIHSKSEFMTLERQIKSYMALCQERVNQLKKTQQIFSDLFSQNEQQFKSLSIYLLAGQLKVEAEHSVLSQTPNSQDLFAQQALLDKQQALARFERRLQTLGVLRHTVLLRVGQLRLEQQNTLTLIDQAHEILSLVIPAWRQQMLAVFSLSQSQQQQALYQQLATSQQELQQKLSQLSQ